MLDIFHPYTRAWFAAALGVPTCVQEEAWPAIARGGHILVSAPTGTGKTLSAFLVFLDRFKAEARAGALKKELRLVYISPLKALAGDIRENLTRPLNGITYEEKRAGEEAAVTQVTLAVRTGDTPNAERRRMYKNPPHILITTPESLYLLLSSGSGREMLKTAQTVIIDELHALIDNKRGAHLMLSLARLDALCGKPLQRIGLSATVEPLGEAAAYLAGDGSPVTIAAPRMHKDVSIEVIAPAKDMHDLPQGTIWPEISRAVYEQCYGARSVIACTDGRMMADEWAFEVNKVAGEGFARTHHGCVSKEQRAEAENELRSGQLRLLVATSSMELGIDVGEIDKVLQVAYPKSIASLLQRLGRAGHNPGRVSVMRLFPRTATEGLYCGLTADTALRGGIEKMHPPRLCLDVLAQHLVSMAAAGGYTVDEAVNLARRAYPFRAAERGDVEALLAMLAGDYEHKRDIPVRPRVLYDRINGIVQGDPYSRMLAVSTGGVIPDTGPFTAKTENGVKIGELDEEFVFEQRVGYKFMLGAFAWQITAMDKDTVTVAQTTPEGAIPPFWRNNWIARRMQTGISFGERMRSLAEAGDEDGIRAILKDMGLDETITIHTSDVILRQLDATGTLPDDRTIIAEHFTGEAGEHQLMVHSVFGRQVNAPLSVLLQEAARRITGADAGVFEDDDGILLMARGKQPLPERLLQTILPETARGILEAVRPGTPLFNMAFRYNAGRSLMMGVRKGRRQPLWVQRLRTADMLDNLINEPDHPLMRETKRECLEDYWDLAGMEQILCGIRSGTVAVREIYRTHPSPLSLSLRRQAEAVFMYDYHPTTAHINEAASDALKTVQKIRPAADILARAAGRKKLPEDERQLHSLLMMEGDVAAGELDVPVEWFEKLASAGRVLYIEPGLWIAAEQRELYCAACATCGAVDTDKEANAYDPKSVILNKSAETVFTARELIARRTLRYRGAHDAALLAERYVWPEAEAECILSALVEKKESEVEDGLYYHAGLYENARRETVAARRRAVTRPPQAYAALVAARLRPPASPEGQLTAALAALDGCAFSPGLWETALLPARVDNYRPALLDNILAKGEWHWQLSEGKGSFELSFQSGADTDWAYNMAVYAEGLQEDEARVFNKLLTRGASFAAQLNETADIRPVDEILFALAEKGLARADSFTPVRQWLNREKLKKSTVKQRVSARVLSQTTGRWELNRPLIQPSMAAALERAFGQAVVLCRETAQIIGLNWQAALETLRVWEYTGQARRGYFVEGLSGAQFIHERDYAYVMQVLEECPKNLVWLSASDPAQPWGRLFPHMAERAFLCVPGTAVALCGGLPVVVLERQGALLSVFDEGILPEALAAFAKEYAAKRIFAEKKRINIKQYPPSAAPALAAAGFTRVMMDYALYS